MKILTPGMLAAAASLSLCGAATSQTTTASSGAANGYLNEQVQLGDVIAGQRLNVQEADQGASSATTAIGNAVSASGQNADLGFTSTQTLSGQVAASANPGVNGYSGPYLVGATSAVGNSGAAYTSSGTVSGSSAQTLTGSGVSAATNAYLGGYASTVAADASAVGNTQGWDADNGAVSAASTQSSTGGVSAATSAQIGSTDSASYTATAVANDVEANTTNSPVNLTVSQTQQGATTAATGVAVTNGGDSTAVTSAVANNANVYSDSWGDSVGVTQANSGAVSASTTQTLNAWYGAATSSAYGVGNSTVVSNAGSYTGVSTDQSNSGGIEVASNLYSTVGGQTGGGAASTATGVGNAVSAYACASCNGTVSAKNKQVNSGSVKVTTNLSTQGLTGTAAGAASAIGNTAAYDVVSSGND